MIIFGAAALISFWASVIHEIPKHYIGNIWEEDKEIRNLRNKFEERLKLLDPKKNLPDVDRIRSRLPPDWLNQLENCFYDIEDIQATITEKEKKIVTKFLDTCIKYAELICTEATNEDRIMEAGDSNTQDYERFYELGSSREDIKSDIIKELTSTTTDQFRVSILGMAGLGKTLLAKAIADEELIARSFPIIFTLPQSSIFSWASAIDHIKSTQLVRKDVRSLILLDGVHQVDNWYKFKEQCHAILHPGSKLLITTLNPSFADKNGTHAFWLPPLSLEDCFSFICKLANGNGNLSDEDMLAILQHKRELAESSKGLPLLANQIGILLAAEGEGKRLAMITKITGRNPWELEEFKRPLLKLEVVSLVAQNRTLRRFLAYCSLFPPDHVYKEGELLKFWMAGSLFVPASRNANLMSQITRGYFAELLSYSIFETSAALPVQQPRYKLHRLYYDMALNLASNTFCQIHIHKSNPSLKISDATRHVSLNCENGDEIDMDHFFSDLHSSCSNLRTFLFVKNSGQNLKKNPTFFKWLTRLRVLDLSYTNLTTLEEEDVSNLTYLRYLDLSFTPIIKLPTFSKSPKLQVLKLNHCAYLRDSNLTLMTNLISLEVSGLDSMPSGIGKLIYLERLDVFTVGQSDGFKITELSNLNCLTKSLCIKKLENVESKQEAEKAMLLDKKKLERLELEWTTRSAPNDEAEQVLEGLQPPVWLRELKIINYCGAQFPKWLNDGKTCVLLKYIHLQGCKALPWLHRLCRLQTLRLERMCRIDQFTGQGLPYVETLILSNMEELDIWIDLAANHMPHLFNLRVHNCIKLRVLPPLDRLRLLKKLEVIWCPKLEKLPTLPTSLTSLIIVNNDKLKARCQTGGADRHKIRHIIELVINSEPVDTSEPDPKGKPNEDKIISRSYKKKEIMTSHLLQHTTTKNDTKLKAPIDSSEPHPTTSVHTSSDIEDTSESDPTTASHIFQNKSPMSFIFFLLPKDHETEEDTIIQLWMAAEFINDENEGRVLFRSFFIMGYLLHCGSNFMTGKDRYRINTQMINELGINQKDNGSCYLQWNKDCINIPAQSILHVSLLCNAEIDATTFKTLEKYRELRTLLFLVNPGHRAIQIPSQLLSSFKELRILDLSRTYIMEFPSAIGYMKQLRYLDLSWTLIEWLPDVICFLTELQTLKLRGCSNITILPKQLSQLTKLRHLDADVLGQLEAIPEDIGALVNLRTLPAFLVGTEEGCKITELRELNSLSGELCIANLENVGSASEAQRANLAQKCLKKLELRWTPSAICGMHQESYSILQKLEPESRLEELQIVCYEGIQIPSWMGKPGFRRLERINLYMCQNLSKVPLVELLPSLLHLELVGLNKVKSINLQREDDAFPKLVKLEIREMQIMRDWKWQQRTKGSSFKSLTHLIIDNCPELEEFDVLPHLSSIKYFEIRKCPKLHYQSDKKLPDTLEEIIVEECPQIQQRGA